MSIKSIIISQIQQIAQEFGNANLPALTEDLVMTESGLDSLAVAILVTRLEDTLGVDPFTEPGDGSYPVTLGDFIQVYEHAAGLSSIASGQDR
jgi:acyl carrier protein